jgi:hypothetical protein
MSEYSNEDLCGVITHTANGLKALADEKDRLNASIKELILAISSMHSTLMVMKEDIDKLKKD